MSHSDGLLPKCVVLIIRHKIRVVCCHFMSHESLTLLTFNCFFLIPDI